MSLVKSLQYFTVICNVKIQNDIVRLLKENEACEIQIIYGYGSARKGILAQAFGFAIEEKKAVIYCILSTEKAKELIDTLYNEYNFKKENTGVAFSTEIQSLVF